MDIGLIEASFAAQYGIRLRQEKGICVSEFLGLLAGLLPETPLGFVMAIRGERDRKRILGFGKNERKIYEEWKRFVRKRAGSGLTKTTGWTETSTPTGYVGGLQKTLEGMFG